MTTLHVVALVVLALCAFLRKYVPPFRETRQDIDTQPTPRS